MEKCYYCQSYVKRIDSHTYYCDFCQIKHSFSDNETPSFKGLFCPSDLSKSPVELKKLHVIDLLLMLRHCREERREFYSLMRTIGKVKNVSKDFEEGYRASYQDYLYWTKKVRVVETLIQEKAGYIPKAVTNELLNKFYDAYSYGLDTAKAV